MSQIQLLRVFLNQRLTAAAEEIFGAVEQTIAVYQEECCRTKKENDRLQKLLDLVIKPEIKLHRGDLQEVPISEEEVPPEQHHCENKWNPSRLIAAADEIFGVVEQTITDYQEECFRTKEENDRLQKLLDIVINPEVKVHRTDLQKVTVSEEEEIHNILNLRLKMVIRGTREDPGKREMRPEKVNGPVSVLKRK
ncbi:hypothetical protein UPYG_G00277300 [Umbra pygmaea]|uniref:Uncharacterized protein n=1 Tax=Umbra pygmaea TaxID=75934 RepID=A0ABD0W6V5_UMBPY